MPLKILIADDEPLIRKSLAMAASSRGHEVKTAGGGREALALWAEFEPDLAFVDVLMPEEDGLWLLKNLPRPKPAPRHLSPNARENAAREKAPRKKTYRKTKIIMISAHDEMTGGEIKKAGADLFVKKPFEDVFRLIERGERLAAESPLRKKV